MSPQEQNLRDTLGLNIPGEGHKNYSVKAGAGGGKSTTLSFRICNQIIGGTPIEEFVIITYTNAAATEIREKITQRLQELIDQGGLDDTQLDYATKALNTIELMQISTIHSFLFKILKEYAFESGIVMDARMLEAGEDAERKSKFFQEWYRDKAHFDEMKQFRDDWVYVSKSGKKTDHYRDVIENLFYDLANVRETVVYDTSDHTADFEKEAVAYVNTWRKALINFKNELENNRPTNKDKSKKKLLKDAEAIMKNISEVEAATSYGIDEALKLAEALKIIKKNHDKGTSLYGAAKDSESVLKSVYPTYPEIDWEWDFSLLYNDFMLPAQKTGKVVEYACKIQKAYQAYIDAETEVISNDDILYRSEQLLLNHADILDALRQRYSKIYVDEFQDTTGLQTRIVTMLSEKVGTKLEDNDLSEDKLLVVGDAKQSIYRFTGAEKAVYDKMDNMMDTLPNDLAESVTLDSNFRSNSSIVDWVNKSYGSLMSAYTPMVTDWNVAQNSALHGVYRYNDADYTHSVAEDATEVVSLINTIVGNPTYFIEKVKRDKSGVSQAELHQIQYSDIMVITKNTTNMHIYVEAFSKAGIPVNVQGKFQITDDEVLKNFVLLVQYFARHKSKKNRMTAMQVVKGMGVSQVATTVLADIAKELQELRKHFRECDMESAAIIQYLLSREELYVPKGKKYTPEDVKSYRIRLHQMVESTVTNNGGDLLELAQLMENYRNSEIKREIPLESNENAVQLMNAHQSKGLTGGIVILADRSAKEGCRYSSFRKDGKYYPTAWFKHSDYGQSSSKNYPSYGYDKNLLDLVYTEEKEESIRLQYVAATRAAHAMIIMPPASNGKPWFTDAAYGYAKLPDAKQWIEDRKADTTAYTVVGAGSGATHKTVTLKELEKNLTKTDMSKLAEIQLTTITPSSLEPSGTTGYSSGHKGYVKEQRPSANVFGTVMHRVYEMIFMQYDEVAALSANEQLATVERMVNQAILEQRDEMRSQDDPKEFVSFLKDVMAKYMSSVIAPIIAEADKNDDIYEIYPEYCFSFYIKGDEREQFIKDFEPFMQSSKEEIDVSAKKIRINGQADLVVKKKDGTIKVYDYKSDVRNGMPLDEFEESLEEKYAGQLALYRYAIGKDFGVDHVETELIHLYR